MMDIYIYMRLRRTGVTAQVRKMNTMQERMMPLVTPYGFSDTPTCDRNAIEPTLHSS